MKHLIAPTIALFSVVQLSYAASLPDLLKQAATNDGGSYLETRNEVVAMGTNALPELCRLAGDKDEPWNVHLVARICIERIVSSNRIDALRQKEWLKDPEFDKTTRIPINGPVNIIVPLVTKRFKEEGLWYYYVEMNWKNTGEGSLDRRLGNSRSEVWPVYGKIGLDGEPEYFYYVKSAIDRLQVDPELNDKADRRKFEFLKNEKIMEAVPTLIKSSIAYSKSLNPLYMQRDEADRLRGNAEFVESLLKFAAPSDADTLLKHIDATPHLARLKPKVEELKARKEIMPPPNPNKKKAEHDPVPPMKEPPFRLGQKPIGDVFPFAK